MTSQLQAVQLVYQPLKAGRDVILGILPFSHIYVSRPLQQFREWALTLHRV